MVVDILIKFWDWMCSISCYARAMDDLAVIFIGCVVFFLIACALARLTGTKLDFDELLSDEKDDKVN